MNAETAQVLSEGNILLFLIQFSLLLGAAKLLGIIFSKLHQPTVTADILVGVFLGPSILGRFAPALHGVLFPNDPLQYTMLDTVSWLGILFLLLVTGLEVNLTSVWRQKGNALWISLSDIIIPIILSAAVLYFLPDRYLLQTDKRILFTLFMSTIMTISAMPISIRVMRDLGLLRTDMGFLTVSALSINDVIGWVVFTLILGIYTQGSPDLLFVASLLFFTGLFLIVAFTAGKRVISSLITTITQKTSDPSGYSLTIIALTGLAFGAITQKIGIHALFGFFIAGLISGEARDLSEKTRSTITQIVYAVFVPVFFANIGIKIDIIQNFDLFLVVLLTVLGIGARFTGAYLGAIFARTTRAQRWPIAALHTPGGEMHIVVGTLALELQLVNETVFVAIIVAAVLSSITLGPWLSYIIKRTVPREALQIKREATIELVALEKFDALRELCTRAAQLAKRNPGEVYDAAQLREEGMSTGLEKGIAIPHARLEGISKPVIVFGRSIPGIDWNSADGVPAKIIFFILTDYEDADTQIGIYRQLLSVVSGEQIRNEILNAVSVERGVQMLNHNMKLSYITT